MASTNISNPDLDQPQVKDDVLSVHDDRSDDGSRNKNPSIENVVISPLDLDTFSVSPSEDEYSTEEPNLPEPKPKIWCDELIKCSSTDRHLTEITLAKCARTSDMSEESYKAIANIFTGSQNWKSIPQLTVITGKNGQGKSLLLKYIYHTITESRHGLREESLFNKGEVLYIGSDHDWTNKEHRNTKSSVWDLSSHARDKWMPQVRDYFEMSSDKSEATHSFAKKVIQTLTRSKTREELVAKKLTEEEIEAAAAGTVDYEINDLKIATPISFLEYVFKEYKERFDLNKSNCAQIGGVLRVFDRYTKLSPEYLSSLNIGHGLELREFLKKFTHEKDFNTKSIEDFVNYIMGPPPWQEFNDVLQKYNFKYNISFETDVSKHAYKIVFKKGDDIIIPDSLSSGEKLILNLFSWKYYVKGLKSDEVGSYSKLDNKVKIVLLDEFDSHFDPKLCKLFLNIIRDEFVEKSKIQVMITTHRIDTVALAPKDSIFVINNINNHVDEIVNCHPLQAMFRMTSNLRDMTNYQHIVYTEGLNDAYFYEGVYSSLRAYCSEIREGVRKQIADRENQHDYYWYIKGEPFRILSERGQLSFHSTSTDSDGGEGGCEKVISFIQTNLNNIAEASKIKEFITASYSKERVIQKARFESMWLFGEPKLHTVYGIIDHDNNNGDTLDKKSQKYSCDLTQSIKILGNRYSLENFIFDPFIFCSSFADEQIKAWIDRSNIDAAKSVSMYKACMYIKQVSISYQHLVTVQDSVDQYFAVLKNTIYNKIHKKLDDMEQARQSNFKSKIENMHKIIAEENGFENITIIAGIDNKAQVTITYPKWFLKVRGHGIEDWLFPDDKLGKQLTSELAVKIYHSGLSVIPLDLAQVFFELNDQVIKDVRGIIGKGPPRVPLQKIEMGIKAQYDDIVQYYEEYDHLIWKHYNCNYLGSHSVSEYGDSCE